MKEKRQSKKSIACFLISCIFILSTFCVIKTAKTNTNTYLRWEGNPGVEGYIEIINLPKVLTIGETYKITANFSVKELDYADAVKFGRISWALQANNENYQLGYSFLDANITKNQEHSTTCYWGFSEEPTIGGGRLVANANIRLINSTDDSKTNQTISVYYSPIINLRIRGNLTIYAENKQRSLAVDQGSSINLTGQLLSDFNRAEISVGEEAVQVLDSNVITYTFTSPSGKDTNQSVTTNSDGYFHFKFKPNATGIWFVTAYYPGSPFILPSTSNIIAVTVNPC